MGLDSSVLGRSDDHPLGTRKFPHFHYFTQPGYTFISRGSLGLGGAEKFLTGALMSSSGSVLFAAGHGFHQFAISRDAFNRSLYYNLLLQPSLAIPDHYFLQGEWLGAHLDDYPSRDSWVEVGLRNGFVAPYFRRERQHLSDLLTVMQKSDRRGFSRRAGAIAQRIDRTPFQAQHWSSAANSASFGVALTHYLGASEPPVLELGVDPDDFVRFWTRSREWIGQEIEIATERSSAWLRSDGILLSQLIQVSGERLLGPGCGQIDSVDSLVAMVGAKLGKMAEREVRVYYTTLCELYNRSLADTLLAVPNSPRWERHVAAMDLWREDLLPDRGRADRIAEARYEIDVVIDLPRPHHLRSVSGDVLLAIRQSPACERYFESLSYWRADPHDRRLQDELVTSLSNYSREIMKHVGREVGVLGLRPQFISKAADIGQVIGSVPGVVQGFLAVGATAGAVLGDASPVLPAGLFSLFCLQVATKYYAPSQQVEVSIAPRNGARIRPDITISRA